MNVELVEIGADTPGQSNVLRVLTFEGSGNGPAIYMQAGLHAQEIPGLIALDQLLPKLQRAENEGRLASTITVVPHANPIGLSQAVYGDKSRPLRHEFDEQISIAHSRNLNSLPPALKTPLLWKH